jgi:hypothetical protein
MQAHDCSTACQRHLYFRGMVNRDASQWYQLAGDEIDSKIGLGVRV